MTVNLQAPDPASILAVPGTRLGIAEAGVRKVGRKDLTVILLDEGSIVAGVFTQNRYCAAPVQVCREHLSHISTSNADTQIRALVINTGNANAGTGAKGLADARATTEAFAALLKLKPQQVLPFSTGVIMENLPVDRIVAGLPAAIADAQAAHWAKAAEGIMTTDTVPKAFSQQVMLSGQTVTITGISKGAGMIRPNMATMLGFLATDANIAPNLLPALATDLANSSFNRITIDGDTSTNDSFIVMATRKAAHPLISSWDSADGKALREALMSVAQKLAHAIVRDGEGATKFITLHIEQGRNEEERGVRGTLIALLHSKPAGIFTNPVVILALFDGSLFALYMTPLFGNMMPSHLGHLAMTVHFLLAGTLFFHVIIGIDPNPRKVPHIVRIVILFAAMSIHAFFAVALISTSTVIDQGYFASLQTPWNLDLLADQRAGGSIAWAMGELPILLALVATFIQWMRDDKRETKRIDRNEARMAAMGEPDELAQYNTYLNSLAMRDLEKDK